MSQPRSTSTKPTTRVQPNADRYTVLLIIALLALLVGCVLLYLELAEQGVGISQVIQPKSEVALDIILRASGIGYRESAIGGKMERSPFESNLFTFKSKKANRVASYCLLAGLGFGFLLGCIIVFCTGFSLWYWFRTIAFSTIIFALLGLVVGFVVGTRIDKKKRR